MIRVRLTSDSKHGKKNEVKFLDRNEAFGLIDSGKAIVSKDMTESDEEQADGNATVVRTHKSK